MNDKYHCSCQQEETSPVDLALLCTKYPELLSKCRQSLAENQQCEMVDVPIDYLAAGLGPDGAPVEGSTPDSITLARFELTNGNQIEFIGVRGDEASSEVGVRELGLLDRQTTKTFLPGSKLSALDMYHKLAAKDAPIPKLLLDIDTRKDKGAYKNKIVDFIEDVIPADLDELGIAADVSAFGPSGDGGPGQQYCVPGDGYNLFRNHNCETISIPSNTWWWCDPQAHYYHRDRWTTNHKRRYSLGVTSACNGPAATQHYYKNAVGRWKHRHTWHLPSGYWHWTRWEGSSLIMRDRWIRHRCITGGGNSFVRCVSFFYT